MINKVGNITQAHNCMRRLFCCNSVPLAILESIIRSPKNAEPLKAIHNILLNPLKGACIIFPTLLVFDKNKD